MGGSAPAGEKRMSFIIVLAALCLLMLAAYRGFSVILFAPIAALLAVLLTEPSAVLPVYSGLFMDKMVIFVKLYFPVFLLGAVFGKVIELSGFSKSIVAATIRLVGRQNAVLAIVIVCGLLTYGGVSLFVVVFAVYPFAAEAFRIGALPKRLIPVTIALGAFTFTMDSLPGTPQIQNIIPAAFFGTNAWAAPWLGLIGAGYILACGLTYIYWRLRQAAAVSEGYVVAEGATAEQVAPVMLDSRVLVYEMTSTTESLESLFFSLTGGEGMQVGHAAGPVGDYRRFNDAPKDSPTPPPSAGAIGGQ